MRVAKSLGYWSPNSIQPKQLNGCHWKHPLLKENEDLFMAYPMKHGLFDISTPTLKILAAIVWFSGAIFLIFKGGSLLAEALCVAAG